MRILIINPFGRGDVLFTTPLIANLKEAFPDSYIGFVANAKAKDIAFANPHVDKVFIYEKDRFRKLWKSSRILCIRQFLKWLAAIKKKKFDMAFDLSMGQEYGFFAWLIGIKKRIGYDYKNRGVFLTDKIPITGYTKKHIAEYYLGLLKLIGVEPKPKDMEFPLGKEDRGWAARYLASNGVAEADILVALAPGGGASWGESAYRKQWPPQRFAAVANAISERFGAKIILFGDAAETALCNQVASLIRQTPLIACGECSLGQFASLLKRCSLLVCNDGGPLHVAVSQGTRTVSIFGPVDPKVYGPYPASENNLVVKKDLICQPCYRKFKLKECLHAECLNDVETKEIITAVETFLGGEIGGA